ncbi:MAG: cysteine desulfurase [Gemmatimonadota bacterium]|jgi:cysteine desulfurase|nr:MAG: cysteine desulfurase [Gemmatimonadota bacterium]
MTSMQADPKPIYLDHAATSPLRPEVWGAMDAVRSCAFNPVSPHAFGRRAHECLEDARAALGELLGCSRHALTFTGGGTESDNLAILGFARANLDRGPCLILSAIEHMACLEAAKRAEIEGAEVRLLPVDRHANVRLDALQTALEESAGRPTLVSIMWANNEVGSVQPMAEIARLARQHGALLHTDAVQALGKEDISLARLPVDLLTATAHKLGGPVGIGLLYRREGVALQPLTFGGSQEGRLWPGTQNPLAAAGLACAVQLAVREQADHAKRWSRLRDDLAARLRQGIPGLVVHAEGADHRLPNLLSVGIRGCDPGALLLALDLEGIAVSGGSACSSGSAKGSHVLAAMGVSREEEYATVRFSFGPGNSAREVERAAASMVRATSRILAGTRNRAASDA